MISYCVAAYGWLTSLFTTRTTQEASPTSSSTLALLFIATLMVLNCRTLQSTLVFASFALLLVSTEIDWSTFLSGENGYLSSYVPFVTAGAWILVPVMVAGHVTASTLRTSSASAPNSPQATSSPQPSAAPSEQSAEISPATSKPSNAPSQSFTNCLVRRILTGSGPVAADPALVADFKAKIQQLIDLSKKWKESSTNMEARARASEVRYRQAQRDLACKELALAQKERRHEELRIMLVIMRSQEQQAMANLQIQLQQTRSQHRETQIQLSDTRTQLEQAHAQLQEAQSTLETTGAQQSNVEQRCNQHCGNMTSQRRRTHRRTRGSTQASNNALTANPATPQAVNDATIQDLHDRVAAYSGRIQQLQESVDRAMAERDEHESNAQAYAEETDRLQYANIELEVADFSSP
ncbi:hypothetical protein FKP32DRAFT_1591107 [Trametes sanguinea]|nr:hypothetical protein FKP32DRAFT_1591107 [Trametes sanguinea]